MMRPSVLLAAFALSCAARHDSLGRSVFSAVLVEPTWTEAPVISTSIADEELPPPTTLPRPRMLWRRADRAFAVQTLGHPSEPLLAEGDCVAIAGRTSAPIDARTGRNTVPHRNAGGGVKTDIRIVAEGTSVRAVRKGSMAPLWGESDAADKGEALVEPVVTASGVFIVARDEITRRDSESGSIDRRWKLPKGIRKYVEAGDMKLATDGHRFVLLARIGVALAPVMATGTDTSPAVTLLERPMVVGNEQVVIGGVLVLYNEYDGVLGAYDPGPEDPPLASLSATEALKAVQSEMVGEERLTCDRLVPLAALEEHWLHVLERPNDPLIGCALRRFALVPQARARPLLVRMAEDPRRDAEDGVRFHEILSAIVADEGLETSKWLVGLIAKTKRKASAWASDTIGLAWEQLWRTGRTSQLGLCPSEPHARHVDALDRRASDGAIGTTHPLLLEAVAADGHWSLICQAREDTNKDGSVSVDVGRHGDLLGDQVVPYLVVESGPGWSFDEFVGSDPTGAYVAVREGACLTVVDTRNALAVTLPGADLRDDGRFGPHRAVAFDAAGKRMLYLMGGEKPQIVVRNLATGAETTADPGAGLLWSARFDPEGRGVRVVAIPSGEWPFVATTLAPRSCRGQVTSFSTYGGAIPRRVSRYIALDGGSVADSDDFLRMFDGRWLVRRQDGALALRDLRGSETIAFPAACHGVVQHADSTRHLILVVCDPGERGVAPLWMYGRGQARQIGQIYGSRGDHLEGAPDRIVQIGDVFIDMDSSRVILRPPIDAGRVRQAQGWGGVFVERSDGSFLGLNRPENDDRDSLPAGPLFWRRPQDQ
jgi:hypothetical protein